MPLSVTRRFHGHAADPAPPQRVSPDTVARGIHNPEASPVAVIEDRTLTAVTRHGYAPNRTPTLRSPTAGPATGLVSADPGGFDALSPTARGGRHRRSRGAGGIQLVGVRAVEHALQSAVDGKPVASASSAHTGGLQGPGREAVCCVARSPRTSGRRRVPRPVPARSGSAGRSAGPDASAGRGPGPMHPSDSVCGARRRARYRPDGV